MHILEESVIAYDTTSNNFAEIMENSIAINKKHEDFIKTKINEFQLFEVLLTKTCTLVDTQFVQLVIDQKEVLTQNNSALKELNKLFKDKGDLIESKVRAAANKV